MPQTPINTKVTIKQLNLLLDVPVEEWIIPLRVYSANANGMVNSGILQDGRYFFKKWDFVKGVHANPRFVFSE